MTTTAKQLLEQRADLVKQAGDILTAANKEDRTMSSDERQKFDKMHEDATALKERADDLHKQETADDVPDGNLRNHEPGTTEHGRKKDPRSLTNEQALRAWMLGNRAPWDLKQRCEANGIDVYNPETELRYKDNRGPFRGYPRSAAEAHKRVEHFYAEQRAPQEVTTMDTFDKPTGSSGPLGGFLVANEMMAQIELAEQEVSGMMEASSIKETGTGAPWPVPTNDDTSEEGAFVGELDTRVDGQLTFDQIVLGAHVLHSKFIKVSIEALQDSDTDLAELIGQRAGERCGKTKNRAFTLGATIGSNTIPGIVAEAEDSGVTNATAGVLDWRQLIQHKHSVARPYRKGPGVGWMVSNKVLEMMKTITDTTNRPLWMPGLVPGEPDLFDGDPLIENSHLADTGTEFALLYGRLSKFWIRQVRMMGIQRANERFIEQGMVGFILHQRVDGRLIDAGVAPVKKMEVKLTA